MDQSAFQRAIAIILGGSLTLFSVGCASGGKHPEATVTGTVTYRERIALPPQAIFEATIEDVSRADAPTGFIGSTRMDSPGNPPIHFTIPYDPTRIDAKHSYAVRARITVDGQLMFTTDTSYPVFATGHSGPVELLLRQTGSSTSTPASSLENTHWRLVQLDTHNMSEIELQRAPHLIFQPDQQRVSGFAGCNQMTGSYETNGEKLKFSQMAGTMMACAQGMDLEQNFHKALAEVTGWRVVGTKLELLDSAGNTVARFEATDAK